MSVAVIYARYSSRNQQETSIEGQLKVCYDFAKQQGHTVAGEYIDRALSGTTDARPEFIRMIEDSAKREFETVIVYQLDRFSRNKYDSAIYKQRLKKNSVRVVSARENITDDASGILMETMLEGMAQYFSVELSQKVRRGMGINAQKGLSNGGRIPFGFKIGTDKRFILDEEKAPFARQIFEMYAAGQTVKEIIDYLNTKQIRTSKGGIFNKNSLHVMLTNKRYIGTYIYAGTEIPDGIPRIVSDELFYKVGEVMEKNKKAPARARAKDEYLLTTKLFCGHCRDMMVGVSGKGRTGKKYSYYSCNKARQELCNKKNVQKDYIEDRVVELARSRLTDENIATIAKEIAAIYKRDRENGDYKRFEKLLSENRKQSDNLMDALKYGKATEMIAVELEKLGTAKTEIERQLMLEKVRRVDLGEEEITFFMLKLRNGDFNDMQYRRILITVFINAIYLYDDRLTVLFNTSGQPVEVTESLIDTIENGDAVVSYKGSNAVPCRVFLWDLRIVWILKSRDTQKFTTFPLGE